MKFRAFLVLALFTAGLTASLALAHDGPPGKGKKGSEPSATGDAASVLNCKPKVSFILKGDFVSGSADANGVGSFAMLVKRANKHGRDYVGTQVTINVDAKTKYKRRGHAEFSDFVAGDWLNVQVRACKKKKGDSNASAGSSSSAPQLLAKRVVGKPKKSEAENSEPESGSTSTSTGETSTGETTTSP